MGDLHDQTVIVALGASQDGRSRAATRVARALRASGRGGDAVGVVAMRERPHGRWGARSLLDDDRAFDALDGPQAIGALSTPLADHDPSRVPAVSTLACGPVALAVAGRPTAAEGMRRGLLDHGVALPDRSASSLLLTRMARSGRRRALHKLIDALWDIPAGYAAVLSAPELLVAVRDPLGLRPLFMGRVGDAPAFSTDAVALHALGGRVERDVAPGEMVVIDAEGEASIFPFRDRAPRPCAQEAWQLAADGTALDGVGVRSLREELARAIAAESPATVDGVVPYDEDAAAPARALAAAWRAPWVPARTADGRIVDAEVSGRRIALLATGGAAQAGVREAVEGLLRAGAEEVHLRLLAPRPTRACPFGRRGPAGDLPDADALCRRWALASVAWTSSDGAQRAWDAQGAEGTEGTAIRPCTACVGAPFPVDPEPPEEQLALFADPDEV